MQYITSLERIGRKKGWREGWMSGWKTGWKEGWVEAWKEAQKETAKNLLMLGTMNDLKIAGLSVFVPLLIPAALTDDNPERILGMALK